MKADWILPENKKLEVTLKILKNNKYQAVTGLILPLYHEIILTDSTVSQQFMAMAATWSKLFAPELVKMYGFTLSSPLTFVVESLQMGPLDQFLRTVETVSTVCMIDATYSLARALHYLVSDLVVIGVWNEFLNQLYVSSFSKNNISSMDTFAVRCCKWSNSSPTNLLFVSEILAFRMDSPRKSRNTLVI